MTLSPQVAPLLARLRAMGSERNRAGMARFAINTQDAFGVSVPELRKLAKEIGTDHALALRLWRTGNHEARLLACFVDDPAKVSAAQMDLWAADFDSWDVCDQATCSLFDQTPHAWKKATAWAQSDDAWIKRGGFALMAGLAWHDKRTADARFLRLLPHIERGAFDSRNFVKKAVNWALRNIGKRNLSLHAAALACAERMQKTATTRAAKHASSPEVRAARWVAADAIRELGAAKTLSRLRKKALALQ
jgi:3-methyladenine DNA glycosylase AlkD